MRIVQIVTQLEAAGAQRVALMLQDGLARSGHPGEVWFLYRKREAFQDRSGIRVIAAVRPSGLGWLRMLYRLWSDLRAARPDVVITHTHYANALGQLVALLAGVPRRIAVQHSVVEIYPPLARVLDRLLGTTGVYSSNAVVSQAVLDSVRHYPRAYRSRLVLIRNGVMTPSSPVDREAVRRRWSLPLDRPLLVNIGRLDSKKNQRVLLEALAALADAHAVIIGEGDERVELERCARRLGVEGRVRLLGELPWEEASAVLRSADVFVFPSLFEGMPMALIEALTAGLPIVASDIPANREAVADAGILVAGSCVTDVVDAVREIIERPEVARRLSARARSRSEAFSATSMVNGYLELCS